VDDQFRGRIFYVDNNSNVVCVTADQKSKFIPSNDKLALLRSYDLSETINILAIS